MNHLQRAVLVVAGTVIVSGASRAESTPSPGGMSAEKAYSYAIGANIGRQIAQRFAADSVEVDSEAFAKAITDVMNGRELELTDAQMKEAFEEGNTERQARIAEKSKAALAAGKAYQEAYAKGEDVKKTESGLLYKVVEAGDGKKPGTRDRVQVHYEGKLIDGTVFDSSYQRGQSAVFGVGQVIPGWQEILQLMPVGATYDVVIPSTLAYGERGQGGIPANSTLHFKVELIGIE